MEVVLTQLNRMKDHGFCDGAAAVAIFYTVSMGGSAIRGDSQS